VMQAHEIHDMDIGALQTSFEEAIHHVHHNDILGLTEEIEKRLFGLFQQVMAGPAPRVCPNPASEEQRMKWEVHASVGNISRAQAMQAYVDLVGAADPSFLFQEEASDPRTRSPAAQAFLQQLEEESAAFCNELSCWQHGPCLLHPVEVSAIPSSTSSHRPVYELAEARDVRGLLAALAQGADPNACDELGVTGLMWAADSGNEDVAKALLAQLPTLDVNKQDDEGQTALHYCVQCDSFAIARRLIDAGAEVSLVDKEGHSPLDLAIQEEMEDYVQLFLERGMMPIDNGSVTTV